jgi:putative DNA-invertase from lambdoid prophage Rac
LFCTISSRKTLKIMRCAIYARVSTTDQNCDMQLREIREYCDRRGWSVAGEYVDTGVSGSKRSRPELDRMMKDAQQHRVDCVIVWKLDRFGRSVLHLNEALGSLRSWGVRFICITQSIDTDQSNPTSNLLLNMLAAIAEFEREMIRERVNAGLKSYRDAYAAGQIGKKRCSRSGKNLPVGRQRRIFSREKAHELREQGKSIREIARLLGIGKGTAARVFADCPTN